jgi:phage terminase large subunit GpA-like protein
MKKDCSCRSCLQASGAKDANAFRLFERIYVACPICGQRSCPHAENHVNTCRRVEAMGDAA